MQAWCGVVNHVDLARPVPSHGLGKVLLCWQAAANILVVGWLGRKFRPQWLDGPGLAEHQISLLIFRAKPLKWCFL